MGVDLFRVQIHYTTCWCDVFVVHYIENKIYSLEFQQHYKMAHWIFTEQFSRRVKVPITALVSV